MVAEGQGNVNQVLQTGRIAYGYDGTNFRPLLIDTNGKLLTTNIKTVSVTKALAAAGNYDAEDVMCEHATTGVAWTFAALARANGGTGRIIKAHALWETTALTPRLTLYLFNAAPTTELDDNKANAAPAFADLAQYVGKIDFPAMEDLGGMSESIATPSTYGNLPLDFECAAAADDLIGILVTRDAITGEVAEASLTIRLTAEQF